MTEKEKPTITAGNPLIINDKGSDFSSSNQAMPDYIELIRAELEKVDERKDMMPSEVGMFAIKSANQTIKEAAMEPDPKDLFFSFWREWEICGLFADTNLGKSALAVQIATKIAKTMPTLYFDFELSAKDFQLRYTDDKGNLYDFPESLYRVEIKPENIGDGDFEQQVLMDIENAAISTGAKVLIIDNLTWLCGEAEKGDIAAKFMVNLVRMKNRHHLSILILTHTPKRNLSNPITQNDMGGSKKLINFLNSSFAIGKSAKDENLRYLKQIKVRGGEFKYGSENVIVCELVKEDAFLQFKPIGYACESEHLRQRTESDRTEELDAVKDLRDKGLSIRQIADRLGLSYSKVQRSIKRIDSPDSF